MQANKVGTGLKILSVVIALVAFVVVPASVSAAEPTADAFAGISFAGAMTDADIAFLRDNLKILRNKLPAWWQYIEDAKPIVIAIDLSEGAHGRAAIAKCCDAQGRGVITFGFQLGQSPDDVDKTLEGKQIAFIGTFVHEVTHIRDQRAGRFTSKTDYKSCVAAEKSGLEKQLEVKRALASTLDETFQPALDEQAKEETSALKSRELWNQYCGMFE